MSVSDKPIGAGRSSSDLFDQSSLFEKLDLRAATVLVDIGCGRGDFTLTAAEIIGPQGTAYGVDAWQEGLDEVNRRASSRGLTNVRTLPADLNKGIPLESGIAEVCLMVTVLHDLLRESTGEVALREIARILKPGGRLAIVEFRKIEGPPGPPLSVRLSAEEVEGIVRPFGFRKELVADLGPYLYLFMTSL